MARICPESDKPIAVRNASASAEKSAQVCPTIGFAPANAAPPARTPERPSPGIGDPQLSSDFSLKKLAKIEKLARNLADELSNLLSRNQPKRPAAQGPAPRSLVRAAASVRKALSPIKRSRRARAAIDYRLPSLRAKLRRE